MDCVYILYSQKLNRFYTGFTTDFETRLEYHKNAASHKFTSNAIDWNLFLIIHCESKSQALQIEKHIKKMKSKTYTENLAKCPEMVIKLKEKYR